MKAVGFDLGHTLINYKNTPLSWKSLYADALLRTADYCNIQVNDNMLSVAENILCKYNTRINPNDMVYVGDEEKDIIGANAAGNYSVFIDRHENNTNPGEKLRISSLLELKLII